LYTLVTREVLNWHLSLAVLKTFLCYLFAFHHHVESVCVSVRESV